ncbi:MAG TPA: hypothetical protein DDW77_11215 [Verrucomicrobiales bacterium]|nr:hypothetical protein [Verrucomicrobiales bacterium]
MLYICKCLSEFFYGWIKLRGSENVTISQLEGCFAIQTQGSFTIHFLMAIRAVQDPHGLFAIQNAIPKIDLKDPGLELVCGDIKLFRNNLP